jgi:hypothetical protein
MILTNSILSEKLKQPLFKFRRWTKELLPPDPVATQRGGVARELTLDEGFYVYLGGLMVNSPGFTFYIVRRLMTPIWAMLKLHNMVPEISEDAVRVGIDREIKIWNQLIIFTTPNPKDNSYHTLLALRATTSNKRESMKDAIGRNYVKSDETYIGIETFIKAKESGFTSIGLKEHLDNFASGTKPKQIHTLLPIDQLLTRYLTATGTMDKWQTKLDALLDQDDPKKLELFQKVATQIYKI